MFVSGWRGTHEPWVLSWLGKSWLCEPRKEYLDSIHRQLPTQWELVNCAMTFFSILLLACFHSKGVVAGIEAKREIHIWIICFPVSIHGCQLRENMDIRGTSVQTTYVKTTEECAKICSKTPDCDSFWCHTYGGVEKRCHLKRNGKFRKAAYKTGGICSKGRFSNCFPKH